MFCCYTLYFLANLRNFLSFKCVFIWFLVFVREFSNPVRRVCVREGLKTMHDEIPLRRNQLASPLDTSVEAQIAWCKAEQ